MKTLIPGIAAMAIIVVSSNILVQFPVGNWLTWGAFTYPFAFLVSELVNRFYGPAAARRVVLAGFAVGLMCSAIGTQITTDFGPLVTMRIAFASGLAFLVGQLLDVSLFNRVRNAKWWRGPLLASLLGSTVDTMIFFPLAFAGTFAWMEPASDTTWAIEAVPLLGIGAAAPLWLSLAAADWLIKLSIDLIALLPFRIALTKYTTTSA